MSDERRDYVIARIQEALRHDERVAELELATDVVGETVVVSGVVETPDQREAVTAVLEELLPGSRIANETVVGHYPETDEVERL
jgi:C4-type Zn-finger protein